MHDIGKINLGFALAFRLEHFFYIGLHSNNK